MRMNLVEMTNLQCFTFTVSDMRIPMPAPTGDMRANVEK